MRYLLLLLASLLPLHAASFSINPITIAKAIHQKSSPSTKIRRITGAVLVGLNYTDYRTTIVGTGQGACELNPLLNIDGCKLNRPKFTFVKVAVFGYVAAQELPVWKRHQEGWNKLFTATNLGASIPLAIAVTNNFYQLSK